MVNLSKEDRKKLVKISKKTKWRELKEIEPINETIKELDIYDDQVNLLCSEYLIESGKTGEFDEEEMFRQCREADKVKKRLLKRTEKEGKKGLKQGRGGRGGGGSDRKLQQSTIKNEEEEKEKKEKEKKFDSIVNAITSISSKVFGSLISNDGDLEKVLSELKIDKDFLKLIPETFFGMLIGLLSFFMGDETAKGFIVVSSAVMTGLYSLMRGLNFFGIIDMKSISRQFWEKTKEFWEKLKEMLGWLKKKSKDLYKAFRYGGGGDDDDDDDDDDNGGGGDDRERLEVDVNNETLQEIMDNTILEENQEPQQDPSQDPLPDPSPQQEVATTNISPNIISTPQQYQALTTPKTTLDPQTQQLLTSNQLAIDKLLSTTQEASSTKIYQDGRKKTDVVFDVDKYKDQMERLRKKHPDKYGDWSDEKFKEKYEQVIKQRQDEEMKKVVETKPPQQQAPLVAEGYGYQPIGKDLPSTEGKTTPKSYWENFSNFGEYMPSATSLITTGMIGAYSLNAYLKGRDALNKFENDRTQLEQQLQEQRDTNTQILLDKQVIQEEQEQRLQEQRDRNTQILLDKKVIEEEQQQRLQEQQNELTDIQQYLEQKINEVEETQRQKTQRQRDTDTEEDEEIYEREDPLQAQPSQEDMLREIQTQQLKREIQRQELNLVRDRQLREALRSLTPPATEVDEREGRPRTRGVGRPKKTQSRTPVRGN